MILLRREMQNNSLPSKKVAVAMSGGVDSSVSAALLQRQGFEVQGVYMKNWSPLSSQSLTDCPWEQDQADAEAVCGHLGIPFRSINFEAEYREKVVEYLLREYAAGHTPNPDVMCNKEIKFQAFRLAVEKLGVDYIATGHYAELREGVMYRGVDEHKDQSYFLYALNKEQLARVLFPVGGMPKSEVRRLAEEFGLPTATKKDSQGICFIGHLNLKDFIEGEIGRHAGSLYLLPKDDMAPLAERMAQAFPVGKHRGVAVHTIGERAGSYLDNRLYKAARGAGDVLHTYIVAKDFERNHLFITDNREDRALYAQELVLDEVVATGMPDEVSPIDVSVKEPISCQIRYGQKAVAVEKMEWSEGRLHVHVAAPVWAAAPGQSVVLYAGSRVLGGGVCS